jgi:hypothetical protein
MLTILYDVDTEGSGPKLIVVESWIVAGSDPETIAKIPLSPQTDGFAMATTRILQVEEGEIDVATLTDAEPLLLKLLTRVVYVTPPSVDN